MNRKEEPNLSIVMPTFNEALIIRDSVRELSQHFDLSKTELIIVDDGSTDDTVTIAADTLMQVPGSKLIKLSSNTGKGAAVRAGISESSGAAVLFMDADLSVSLVGVDDFLAQLSSFDVVIGSRSVPGSLTGGSSAHRIAMGRFFSFVMRRVTRLGVRDSQCGFKAFRGDVGRLVFGLSECNRYAFDPEVLRIANILGFSIREYPVIWTAGAESKVRPVRDSIRTAIDLIRVRHWTRRARVERRARHAELAVDQRAPAASYSDAGAVLS